MLLNQNLLTLVSNTPEPQSIFLNVQAQLIELVGNLPASTPPKSTHLQQVSSTSPPQVYRARIAIDEPCLRYQQGRCRYAAGECDRLHVDATSKFGYTPPTRLGGHRPSNIPRSVPQRFAVPFRDFARGECSRGTTCRFVHDAPGPQALTYGNRRRHSVPQSQAVIPKNA